MSGFCVGLGSLCSQLTKDNSLLTIVFFYSIFSRYNQVMIYLILATICFSLSFGLIKNQLAVLPSDFVVLCRLILAMIIFLPFVRKVNLRKFMIILLIGAIQFGVMYLCFIKAFKYLQGCEIALLTTTTPVFVALWSIIFGEKFKLTYILCILMSVFGAGIVVWQNMPLTLIVKGIILMETCNCSFALGQVLWKNYVGKEEQQSYHLMSFAYLGAVLLVLPFICLNVNFQTISLTKTQILSLLYLGIIPTGIGFWLWNKGAEQVKSYLLAIMNNFKIPLGVLFAIIIFHEKVDLINFLIGSSIILIAILILNYQLKRDN